MICFTRARSPPEIDLIWHHVPVPLRAAICADAHFFGHTSSR